jgi:heat shock protein HslJ
MRLATGWRSGGVYGLIVGLLVLLLSSCAGGAPAAPELPGMSEQGEANIAGEEGGQSDILPAVTATIPPEEQEDSNGEMDATATATTETAAMDDDAADEDTTATADTETSGLEGTTWQWMAITGGDEDLTVDSPENYTLEFDDNGGLAMQVDCNRATGTFAVIDGDNLDIELGPITLAACGPESLDAEYMRLIAEVETFEMVDGNLELTLSEDAGTMNFEPAEDGDAMETETTEAEETETTETEE